MKANSPTCDKVKPVFNESSNEAPATKAAEDETNALITNVMITRERISFQYCIRTCGSIIIPTETKKIAPNKSLILCVSLIIRSLSIVSESMEPITNAPNADEKPTLLAMITMPKHKPMEIISNVSSLIYFFALLKKVGIK